MDIEYLKKKSEEYLQSEQYIIDQKRIQHREELRTRNIEYIHNMITEKRVETIRKLITKYSSDEYINRERSIGAYEPRCPLYDVLFDYAVKYCTSSQYKLNDYFGEEQYDIDGVFVIGQIYGQGSFIYCLEVPDNEIIPHDFKHDPEELVTVYDPEGNEVKTCNYHVELLDILCQIKDKKLSGYTVKHMGNVYEIKNTGKVIGNPNLYDKVERFLVKLVLNK